MNVLSYMTISGVWVIDIDHRRVYLYIYGTFGFILYWGLFELDLVHFSILPSGSVSTVPINSLIFLFYSLLDVFYILGLEIN